MPSWLLPALGCLFLWGLWGLFPKVSVRYLDPASVLLYEVFGCAAIGLVVILVTGFRPAFHPIGFASAAVTGLAGFGGAYFYLVAAKSGSVSSVVTVTALYPIVTIGLAYLFLGEGIEVRQMLGVALALAAICLLSS